MKTLLLKISLLLLFTAFGFSFVHADNTWVQQPGAGPAIYLDITNANNGRDLAVVTRSTTTQPLGQNGYIYTSKDFGQTWIKRENAGLRQWKAIASDEGGRKLIAIQEKGFMYLSNDWGDNWQELTTAGDRYWIDVDVSGNGNYMIATSAYNEGNQGKLYLSRDNGDNWSPTNAGFRGGPQYLKASISYNGSKIVAVNPTDGLIYISTDEGDTWNVRFIDAYVNTWTIPGIPGGCLTGEAVHSNTLDGNCLNLTTGRIYKNGLSDPVSYADPLAWVNVDVSDTATSTSIIIGSGSNASKVFISRDLGETWRKINSGEVLGELLWTSFKLSRDSEKILLATRADNNVFYSKDAGLTWDTQTSLGLRNFTAVDMSSDGNKLFAVSGGTDNTDVYGGIFSTFFNINPTISNLTSSSSASSTIISWTTDLLSDSKVFYYASTSSTTAFVYSATSTLNHLIEIPASNTIASTTYNFYAVSKSIWGITSTSTIQTFTTTGSTSQSTSPSFTYCGTPYGTATSSVFLNVSYPCGGEFFQYLNYGLYFQANGITNFGFKLLKGTTTIYETTSSFSLTNPIVYQLDPAAHPNFLSEPLTIDSNGKYRIGYPITGLTVFPVPGDDYKFEFFNWDSPDVRATSGNFSYAEQTPPVVTNVLATSTTASTTVITWITDEPATGFVNYGSTTTNWVVSPSETGPLKTSHSISLSNLTSSTIYKFRVYSSDVLGNSPQGFPPEYSFTTLASTTASSTPYIPIIDPNILIGNAIYLGTSTTGFFDIALDGEDFIVTEMNTTNRNSRLLRINKQGQANVIYTYAPGNLWSIAVAEDGYYVSTNSPAGYASVLKITRNGIASVIVNEITASGALIGLTELDGKFYMLAPGLNRIMYFTRDGQVSGFINNISARNLKTIDGNLIMGGDAQDGKGALYKIATDTTRTLIYSEPIPFVSSAYRAITNDGNVYVVKTDANKFRFISPGGNSLSVTDFSIPDLPGGGNTSGSNNGMVMKNGMIYITQSYPARIISYEVKRKFDFIPVLVNNKKVATNTDKLQSTTTLSNVSFNTSIPSGVTITGDSDWNGEISLPKIATITLPAVSGKSRSLNTAVEVGFSGVKLSFNKGVRLLISGQAGMKAIYTRDGVNFTEISNTCSADSQAVGDALPTDGDCKIDVGSDLVIWTKHFTTFATYSETTISTGGGGGGGGYVVPVTTISTSSASTTVLINLLNSASSSPTFVNKYTFTKNIAVGSNGVEVMELQKLLFSLGFLKATPNGNFGPATKQAVISFQKTNKISPLGSVGPQTRIALNGLQAAATLTPTPITSTSTLKFVSLLQVGSRGDEVMALQKVLISLGLLSADVTGYFGNQTKVALMSYQKQNGITQTGMTGPVTRAQLNKNN